MKTIDRILQSIKRDGSVTAKQLAEEFGMTTMGARQHLQGLEEAGIVSFHDVKVKVGRPTRHWSLTLKGHEQFADRHSELTIQMIDVVESLFGSDGLAKVAAEREHRTFIQYQKPWPLAAICTASCKSSRKYAKKKAIWPSLSKPTKAFF